MLASQFSNSIEEHAKGAKPSGELTARFLEYWKDKGAMIQAGQD